MEELEIINELKRLSRRMDDVRKDIDVLNADREIFEDILTRLTAVENALHTQRATQTETTKTIRADIGEVKETVEEKVDELVQKTSPELPKKGLVRNIMDKIRRRR